MVRAVIFDLDDTLYPEHSFVLSGFAAVERWLEAQGRSGPFAKVAAELMATGLRGTIFDATLHRLGWELDPAMIQKMVRVYRGHVPAIRLFDDAEWILTRLRPDFRLGLVTDGFAEAQRSKIAALDLERRTDLCVMTDLLGPGSWKPSPAGFLRCMEALGVRGAECVYVGDNPAKDFVAPNQLGWLSVQVHRPDGVHAGAKAPPGGEAAEHIRSLRELEGVLSR